MPGHREKVDLLAEHEAVEEMAARLSQVCHQSTKVGTMEWIGEIRRRFSAFRTHFIQHMALEERGGYFADLSRKAPQYAAEIERLIGEHRDFAMIMAIIRELLDRVCPEDRLLLRDCKRRIRDLLAYLDRHEQDENLIALSAMKGDAPSS